MQALKDVRAAQIAFEQAHGEYSANVQELREFVRTGEMPVVRAIGQKPDTLSEEEAIELGIIVRDTFTVAVLDTLFLNYANATDERVFKFDLDRFGISPGSGKPFIMRKGRVNAGGRDMPVFLVKDRSPSGFGYPDGGEPRPAQHLRHLERIATIPPGHGRSTGNDRTPPERIERSRTGRLVPS